MPQELDFSLSNSTAKTVRASICKIACKTMPRCGIAALVLLCMGFYFLFPACQTLQQIQTEKNTPYELDVTTESGNVDLNPLMQIEGVERISPVINLSASFSVDEYKLDCEIRAVYSNFLTLKIIQGTMYPDISNMPYLILNKPAAKSFVQDSLTITVSPEDTVIMSIGGAEQKAIVCGIFDDGSETPIVYMSYDVAQKEYGTGEQTELVFLLNNMGNAEDVVSALQRLNIYAGFDSNLTLAWELLHMQGWQTILLSIGLLACAAVLIREKRVSELAKYQSETAMLLVSGMTVSYVEMIYPIRVVLTQWCCLGFAAASAAISGRFSPMGFILGICGMIAIYFLVAGTRTQTK